MYRVRFAIGLSLIAAITLTMPCSSVAMPSLMLAKVGTNIPPGEKWLIEKGGILCLTHRTNEWSTAYADAVIKGAPYEAVFRDELSKVGMAPAGSKPTDLFATEKTNADLQVGALITGLHIVTCMPGSGAQPPRRDTDGSATMSVEWQIYSVAEGKVIARISTSGDGDSKRLGRDTEFRVLERAFASNARAFASSSELATLVSKTSASASRTTGDVPIHLASFPGPLPLKDAPQSVVSIYTGDGMGSGVLISAEGYILTNQHVAGDSGRVRVRWADGAETTGEVVKADGRRDVALIRVEVSAHRALPIRGSDIQIGDTVFAIGTPLQKEFAGTLTRGVVSARRVLDGQTFIQSDVAVDHGNSGGPLLDESGQIVGLTASGYRPDDVSHNINFFVPINDAVSALGIKPAS